MTTTNTAAAPATKPTVRALSNHAFEVRFPCGATAKIFQVSDRGSMAWSFNGVKADGTEHSNLGFRPSTSEAAFELAWCALAAAPAALKMAATEVHALAKAADHGAVTEATKILRKLLAARTGIKFSVRAGTGTGRSWIKISGSGKHGYLTTAERVVLSSIFGDHEVSSQGCSIRPCGHERVWWVCKAAGFEMPEDVKLVAPTWD